ncbi:MAG: response regulator, partial [Candidatus Pacebacteria bacterium]|nr:response regulator [Candidatus Paceibacterota bacterium]
QANVLILDDDRAYLCVVERLLSTRGYCVNCASTYHEFRDCFERVPHDLVMLDVNMPEKTGFEVYREIAPVEGFSVLFVTGFPRSFSLASRTVRELWETEFSRGTTDILYKPFAIKDMLCKVAGLVGPGNVCSA